MRAPAAVLCLLVVTTSAAPAFQADLVPGRRGPEAAEIEGSIGIIGEDGHIRVVIENVNDAKGEPVDANLSVHMKLRVNGRRQLVVLPLVVDTGDGEVSGTLGLTAGALVVVRDVRVRGRDGRTLAVMGVLTEASALPGATTTTTSTTLPPTPSECPAALATCQTALGTAQSDLADCTEELNICEEICE